MSGGGMGGTTGAAQRMGYGQPQQFSGLNNLPQGQYQIPGYNNPAALAAQQAGGESPDRYAALAKAMNPGGMQGPAMAPPMQPQPPMPAMPYQQPPGQAPQRGMVQQLPPQAAQPAQQNMMRKALGDVPLPDAGYGHGTPGGYRLDTAPSTLDPGSMAGLLGIMGGNVNGTPWNRQAANYANWYRGQYGNQAPGGPKAYPF